MQDNIHILSEITHCEKTGLYEPAIAAISTAMSPSGIGIVRISGDKALEVADKMYDSKNSKKLSEQQSHTIHYGYIYDGDEAVDEVLVMVMKGPHSYTGEDTVEINCHGGIYVVKRVLELALKCGARIAQPGEFTKRAFLNGRIDLSQAEAVGDLINSKNEYALKSSVSQLKGALRTVINDIRNKIIYQTAFIETALDDPEHVSLEGYGEQLRIVVDNLSEEIKGLLATCENGRIIKEGIRTVILGKPNAGKSSLLNVLLGEDRAIVTDIAGTTRDVLEEHMNMQGISLNIVDTAGIRDTKDIIEKIGVEKAINYADEADLILCVIDASVELDKNDEEIASIVSNKPTIILLNKTDLDMKVTKEDIENLYFASNLAKKNMDIYREKPPKIPEIIEISAKNEQGICELQKRLKSLFFEGNLAYNDEIYITNIRQKTELQYALDSLKNVMESIDAGMPEDFYSIDLMEAYEHLGSITGDKIGEDLINEIFSKFCMGK